MKRAKLAGLRRNAAVVLSDRRVRRDESPGLTRVDAGA